MRVRNWSVALLALSLTAAACAGGGETAQEPTTALQEEPTTTPAEEPTTAAGEETTTTAGEAEAQADWPDRLVLGLVPSREADVLVENAQPLTDFLSQELGIPVEGFVPQDYTGLIEAMGAGQADIGLFGPFAAVLAMQRYQVEPILISVRFGSEVYRGQWFTNDPSVCEGEPEEDEDGLLSCEGPVTAVEGNTVAFTDQTSTSGFLFPALQLIENGIDPEAGIEPLFTGGHDAAVIAVYQGDAQFGVSFEDARTTVQEEFPDVGQQVIVFNYTEEIPNDGVTVRNELPDDLKEDIKNAFLSYAETEEGQEVLNSIYEIDGFAEVSPGVYDVVERAYNQLQDQIEI